MPRKSMPSWCLMILQWVRSFHLSDLSLLSLWHSQHLLSSKLALWRWPPNMEPGIWRCDIAHDQLTNLDESGPTPEVGLKSEVGLKADYSQKVLQYSTVVFWHILTHHTTQNVTRTLLHDATTTMFDHPCLAPDLRCPKTGSNESHESLRVIRSNTDKFGCTGLLKCAQHLHAALPCHMRDNHALSQAFYPRNMLETWWEPALSHFLHRFGIHFGDVPHASKNPRSHGTAQQTFRLLG